jgi:hypothetical protein
LPGFGAVTSSKHASSAIRPKEKSVAFTMRAASKIR